MNARKTALQHAGAMVSSMLGDLTVTERAHAKAVATRIRKIVEGVDPMVTYIALQISMVSVALDEENRRSREERKEKAKSKRRTARAKR